ncbi:MAG: FAD-dependent oxidoreductase [Oscillospiraceae bacterium]|jgi:thioredoxin reductase (NADPH)|nr:FAD-dependent oxidoreductase [Oscillospiraceae bacterium]
MADIVIIGSGPAGVSASLYAARSGLEVIVISKGIGNLAKAEAIENYYGIASPVSGGELYDSGVAGAKRLGVQFVQEEVVGLTFEERLVVLTTGNRYAADAVIIATGSERTVPKIQGIKEFEGRGVSYCATCDAFFFRNKDVAVLGNGDYALHEIDELTQVVSRVTLLTNGEPPYEKVDDGITCIDKKVTSLFGEQRLEGVAFEDGSTLAVSGLFVALGVAGSTALAKKIGALTDGSKIVVDENMATNIPGLYSAGDCTGGLLQINKAVYEGAKAATEATKFIKQKKAK